MIIWLFASLLALAGALTLIAVSFQQARKSEQDATTRARKNSDGARFISDYLARAGLDFTPARMAGGVVLAAISCGLAFVLLKPLYALGVLAALVLAAHLGVQTIAARMRAKTLMQLPSFLNQVIRRVAAGASVELAINDSLDSVPQPLREILERATRRVRLGYELHDSLEREAGITGLPEFRMLATVLRLNEQFGGSIRGVLENIVDILLVQQQGQRELRALTGETRVTAFVLAALPVAAAAYMLMVNPNFMLSMWRDVFGHQLLVGAATMQALGVFVLWRMVRSI